MSESFSSITAIGADSFQVKSADGGVSMMSAETLMQIMAMRGSQVCAQQMQVQMAYSNKNLNDVEQAEKYMAKMSEIKNDISANGKGSETMPSDMQFWLKSKGVKVAGDNYSASFTPDQWDINKENIKAYIDHMNGQSQMDYIKLQSLTNQNNRLFSLMDAIESKTNQTKSDIIRDIK